LGNTRFADLMYAPVLAFAMGLMMVRLLVLARLLTVEEFASLSAGLLVSTTFNMLGSLGLQTQLQREWPVDIVQGREKRGLVLAAQSNLVATVCALLALLAVAAGARFSAGTVVLAAVGILHGFAQQLFLNATVESRSRGESMRYSNQNVLRGGGALLLGLIAALTFNHALPVIVAEALVTLLIAHRIFARAARSADLTEGAAYAIAWHRLSRIKWVAPLVLMSTNLLAFLIANADRWIAAMVLPKVAFGNYSFAWIILMTGLAIQTVVNAALFPALSRTLAAEGRRAAFRLCVRSSLGILVAGAISAIPVLLAVRWGISTAFPAYATALELVPVFIVVALLRVSDFWSSYLLIVGRESQLLVLNLSVAAVAGVAWLALFDPLREVVAALNIAYLALFLAVVGYLSVVFIAWRARA
jgi:O-antigen/teichoic acid export membrane protein